MERRVRVLVTWCVGVVGRTAVALGGAGNDLSLSVAKDPSPLQKQAFQTFQRGTIVDEEFANYSKASLKTCQNILGFWTGTHRGAFLWAWHE